MVFGCQSSSEKPFVHFSAIKCGNCSRAIFSLLHFSLRKDASVTSLPMPSTKALSALRESNTPGTCSILTAIFLLQAKSPIGSIALNDSLYRNPPWSCGIGCQQQELEVGQWTEHQTEQKALLLFSTLLET